MASRQPRGSEDGVDDVYKASKLRSLISDLLANTHPLGTLPHIGKPPNPFLARRRTSPFLHSSNRCRQ